MIRIVTGYGYRPVRHGVALVSEGYPWVGHFSVTFPDGTMRKASDSDHVVQIARSWTKRQLHGIGDAVGLLRLDWTRLAPPSD